MADTKKTVTAYIAGDATGYKKAMAEAEGQTGKTGSVMHGVFAGVGIAATQLATEGIGKVIDFLGESSKKAMEDEAVTARLTTALRDNVKGFTGTADVMESASAAARKLGFSDDEAAASLARLVPVTHDVKGAQADLSVAEDLARARGIDLATATDIVVKAQLGNVGALKRMGIEVPHVTTAVDALHASTKKATPEQLAAAKAADKQATGVAALAAIQGMARGQAQAYAGTMAGGVAVAGAQVDSIMEKLGGTLNTVAAAVLPPVIAGVEAVAGWFSQLVADVTPFISQVASGLQPAFDSITAALGGIVSNGPVVQALLAALGAVVLAVVVPPFVAWAAATVVALAPFIAIGAAVLGVIAVLDHFGILGPIVTAVTTAVGAAFDWVSKNVLPALGAAFDWIVANVLPAIGAAFDAIVKTVVPAVGAAFGWIAANVLPRVEAGFSFIASHVLPILSSAFDWVVKNVLPALGAAFEFIVKTVIPALGGAFDWVVKNVVPPLQTAFGFIADTVLPALGTAFAFLTDTVIPAISTAFQDVAKVVGGVFDGISGIVRGAINAVIGAINVMIGALDSVKVPAMDIGPIHFAGFAGFNIPKVPTLHSGGTVPGSPGSDVLAVLQAGERVLPRSAPPQAADAAPTVVQLGGVHIHTEAREMGEAQAAEFAQRLWAHLDAESRRRGRPLGARA